jgi:hypothetical protein
MRLRGLLAVGTLLLAGAAWAGPQQLHGVVQDETGLLLPWVTVDIRRVDGTDHRSLATDAQGAFEVGDLPPGRYEVSFRLPSFATYGCSVDLAAGATAKVDARLHVALTAGILVSGTRTSPTPASSTTTAQRSSSAGATAHTATAPRSSPCPAPSSPAASCSTSCPRTSCAFATMGSSRTASAKDRLLAVEPSSWAARSRRPCPGARRKTAPPPVCACSEKIPLAARPVARDVCKPETSGPPCIASGHAPCLCREPREAARRPQPTRRRGRIRSAQTRGVSRPPPLHRSHAGKAARLVQGFAHYAAAMRRPPAVTLREVPARQNALIETPSLPAAPFNCVLAS